MREDLNDPYEFGQPPAEPHDSWGETTSLMHKLENKYDRDFQTMPLGEVKKILTLEEWSAFHDAIKYPNGKSKEKDNE